jgi:hypothetical protein
MGFQLRNWALYVLFATYVLCIKVEVMNPRKIFNLELGPCGSYLVAIEGDLNFVTCIYGANKFKL